jgi:hypothetical protein
VCRTDARNRHAGFAVIPPRWLARSRHVHFPFPASLFSSALHCAVRRSLVGEASLEFRSWPCLSQWDAPLGTRGLIPMLLEILSSAADSPGVGYRSMCLQEWPRLAIRLRRSFLGLMATRRRTPPSWSTRPGTISACPSGNARGVRHGARWREWEQPHTFSWRSASADDAKWMSEKSGIRLDPVLTEASSWMSDRSV